MTSRCQVSRRLEGAGSISRNLARMILINRQAYTLGDHFEQRLPALTVSPLQMRPALLGPVVRVSVRFEQWERDARKQADAFIDPGADVTAFSHRWLVEGDLELYPEPEARADGLFKENASIEIGGRWFDIPLTGEGPVVYRELPRRYSDGYQVPECPWENARPANWLDDLLIGRDFLAHHKLLICLDAGEKTISLLFPGDAENRERRNKILSIIDSES
jgi:hypothetical protein